LGSILSLSRSVLEQRDFIEIQYEKYTRGELNDVDQAYHPPIPIELQKRKRDEEQVIFVEQEDSDSSQEVENSRGKADKKGHQNKKQRHARNELKYQNRK
jgi:hypothetical protein